MTLKTHYDLALCQAEIGDSSGAIQTLGLIRAVCTQSSTGLARQVAVESESVLKRLEQQDGGDAAAGLSGVPRMGPNWGECLMFW